MNEQVDVEEILDRYKARLGFSWKFLGTTVTRTAPVESSPAMMPLAYYTPPSFVSAEENTIEMETIKAAKERQCTIETMLSEAHQEIVGLLIKATDAVIQAAPLKNEASSRLIFMIEKLGQIKYASAGKEVEELLQALLASPSGEKGEEEAIHRNIQKIDEQMRPLLLAACEPAERVECEW